MSDETNTRGSDPTAPDPSATLQITSPANDETLIEHDPAPVTISGTMNVVSDPRAGPYVWDILAATVTVVIGSDQPQPETVTTGATGSLNPFNGGMLKWGVSGKLPASLPSIQVTAHGSLPWSIIVGQASEHGKANSDASPITILANSVVTIDVQSPQDGQAFYVAPNKSNDGVTITPHGTASSDLAILTYLEGYLDGAEVGRVSYDISGGLPWHWVFPPVTLSLGSHTLKFTAYDTSGHSQSRQVQHVQVSLAQDILGVDARSYLGALVEFATWPFPLPSLGVKARITTDMALQHNLTRDDIDSTFHQSIALLLDPDNQAKSTEPVNPVRLCIEVLRKYLKANPPSSVQLNTLEQKESSYLSVAYQSLLQQIGTSYDEIRMARTYRQNPSDQPRLQAIADRLELQLLTPRPDELDDLFFDVGAAGMLSGKSLEQFLEQFENTLEQLFGLGDTTRDPFSQGATGKDTNGQIVRWRLDGLGFTNTDGDGYVYLTLTQAPGPKYGISIFADSALTRELAHGGTASATGTVALAPTPQSSVSGTVTINYQADTTTPITLSAFPRLLTWQRRRLRSDWALESWRISQGPVVADAMHQIARWNLAGVSLVKNTDKNGFVYLTLKQLPGPAYEVDVYADQARTQLIASGSTPDARGTLTLAPANASGVSGTITLDYQADTAAIALSMVPATPPAIDPDLLTDADFSSPLNLNPAYQLYQRRKTTVNTDWFGGLKTQREGYTDPIRGLNAILGSVLSDPQYYPNGMTINDVTTLDTNRQNGVDISGTLSALSLESGAFNRLVRICTFVNAGLSLLLWEWDEVYSILVQVRKKRAAFAWVAAEVNHNILVSPDYFTFPPTPAHLFPTGIDANGLPLGDGAVDPHWTIVSTPVGPATLPAYATISAADGWPIGQYWLRNSSVSRWISPQADESTGDAPGLYTYRTTIELGAYDPSSVWLNAKVAVDNELTGVRLNGMDLALTAGGYAGFTTIALTGGFQGGANTLDFIVMNAGTSPNPSGLRVEFSFGTPAAFSSLPAWRATDAARHAWEALLQGRVDQDASLAADLQRAVDATEKQVLPRLKDALVAAGSISIAVDPEWLSSVLLIDVKATGDRTTTRLDHATQMMQSLFFVLRNQQFAQLLPQPGVASWTLTEALKMFDEEWATMGSYASWNALMLVFLYPENVLLPDLRLLAADPSGEPGATWEKTKKFADFASALSAASPLMPETAVICANDYLKKLNDANYPDLPAELKSGQVDKYLGPYQDPREIDLATLKDKWKTAMDNYQDNDLIAVAFLWEAWYSVAVQIGLELQKAQQFEAALAWFGSVYAYALPRKQSGAVDDERKYFPGLTHERADSQYLQVPNWTITEPTPLQIAVTRAYPYTRYINLTIIDCLLDFADAQFTSFTVESISEARGLYLQSLDLLSQLEAIWPANPVLQINPRLAALRLHAENNLAKLRAGRNITGMLAPAPDSPDSLLPSAYRYSALIDRAKQIVALAQQAENAYLSAMEKGASEAYSALRAKQDLESATAAVKLESLKVTQANDGVSLAKDQVSRSQVQVNHYQALLDSDIPDLENVSIGLHLASFILSLGSAAAGLGSAAAGLGSLATGLGSLATGLSGQASLEEQQMDWQAQLETAYYDEDIAQDQVNIANDTVAIANQDLANANTQTDHAAAIVEFLATKFTNKELYRWMSGVLSGVYSYFLRQATAIARLAEGQLAFERQEKARSIIQSDYWRPLSSAPAELTDTGGMTGADLLLADITQLDQYALDTDQRRLQLTKVISLASLDPVAFGQFTQTGVLRFATPVSLFDRDFPGHYVRLIKQVRVSVVALVPPTQGIRATLANAGVSRVVTVDDSGNFAPVVVRRDPQLVALSSPANATGIFDLTAQSTMLLPFEALGVDTSWELVMPRASNPFDFSTIADVLLAIDYTALDSPDYRRQVIQSMDTSVNADRAYSFRQQFADAWYLLNNPAQSATPMKVEFETTSSDFPPNVEPDSLSIAQVVMYFVPAEGASFVVPATLSFSGRDAAGYPVTISAQATSTDQMISTRRGASAWRQQLIGMGAIGTWTLDLSNPDMSGLFNKQQVQDILFVISYTGQTPAWPDF